MAQAEKDCRLPDPTAHRASLVCTGPLVHALASEARVWGLRKHDGSFRTVFSTRVEFAPPTTP